MKITQQPDALDCAWVAGFFEGEGSITISKGRTGHGQLGVSLAQVDRTPLVHVQQLFGGTISRQKARCNAREFFRWNTWTGNAMAFLIAITPYIVRRDVRDKISLAISFQVQKVRGPANRNSNYTARQKVFFDDMARLNKRGRQ